MTAIHPPSWLSASEKRSFRGVVEARAAAHLHVEIGEIDAVVDYAIARGRVQALHGALRDAPDAAEQMRLHRALMSALATSQRLARGLHLAR